MLDCPDLVLSFQDNPENRLSWSASGKVPTFRTGTSRVYSPHSKRCLTLKERLTALGYPVYKCCSDVALTKCLTATSHMAGNSMHLPSAVAALCVGLACTRVY